MVIESGTGLNYLGEQGAVEQGTHRAAAPSTATGPDMCPDTATEQKAEREEVFSCVYVFVCRYASVYVWVYVRRWQSCQV